MTKELVEEIMDLELEAESRLAKAAADKEALIKKAHEQAHKLVQDAERTLDTEREQRIKQRDEELHAEKQRIIEDARQKAQTIAANAEQRLPEATELLLKKFFEYCHDVS